MIFHALLLRESEFKQRYYFSRRELVKLTAKYIYFFYKVTGSTAYLKSSGGRTGRSAADRKVIKFIHAVVSN